MPNIHVFLAVAIGFPFAFLTITELSAAVWMALMGNKPDRVLTADIPIGLRVVMVMISVAVYLWGEICTH